MLYFAKLDCLTTPHNISKVNINLITQLTNHPRAIIANTPLLLFPKFCGGVTQLFEIILYLKTVLYYCCCVVCVGIILILCH